MFKIFWSFKKISISWDCPSNICFLFSLVSAMTNFINVPCSFGVDNIRKRLNNFSWTREGTVLNARRSLLFAFRLCKPPSLFQKFRERLAHHFKKKRQLFLMPANRKFGDQVRVCQRKHFCRICPRQNNQNLVSPAFLISTLSSCCAWILEQSMGARRNLVRIMLPCRPTRLHRLAESIPWN